MLKMMKVSVGALCFLALVICETEVKIEYRNDDGDEISSSSSKPTQTQVLKKIGEQGIPVEGGITELDYSISGTDFYTHFIRKRRPLVFRGVASDWRAVKNWHDDNFMKTNYGHVLVDVEMGKVYKNELNPRKTMNISDFIDIYKEKSVYLDSPFPQSELIDDLEVPFFMQCPELAPNFTSAHLLFSSGNTSSCFHQDGYENLLTMISGIKVVVLVNYTYVKEVYAENIDTFPGLSPISPEGVDFEKWPLFKDVPFHKITLHPGDIVYIPKNWWHHVRSFQSPNIGVSIWFNTFVNKTQPGDNEEVVTIRDVGKQEKLFSKLVDAAPETIDCVTQNIPISKFLHYHNIWNMPLEENLEKRVKTLKNGFKVPMIGFGTAGLFEKTEELVKVALNEEYRLIDSAQAYNESGVGQAIKTSGINRTEIFIVSKVHPKNLGFESTITSVEQSLRDLQTDYIDLMLIHSKDCDEGPGALLVCGEGEPKGTWVDTWKALEFLVNKGKIRSIGVSNFDVADLEEVQRIANVDLSVVQNWFDPFNTDQAVREWCRRNDVAYMGHSTLGESWVRDGFGYNPVLSEKQLQRIAQNFDADIARVVLRWAIDKDVIVIPRSSNPIHIATNLQIYNILLAQSDIDYIDSLDKTLNTDVPNAPEQFYSSDFVYNNFGYEYVDKDRPTIFVSSDDHWIYAFDAKTGKIKWKTETADETGSSCAFSLSEELIYCGADDSYVRALYTENGTIFWHYKTGSSVTSSAHVVADGTVVIGSHDKFLYALHPNGTLRWRFKTADAIWASPVTNSHGNIVFIASYAETGKNIHAINIKTGSPVWEFEGPGGFISSPVISPDESLLLLCSGYGSVLALDPWTGELVWQAQFGAPIESTPVFAKNSRVFIAVHDGTLVALDSRKGSVLWTKQVSVNITSSPTLGSNGQIYLGGGDGEVLALSQKTGDKIWTQKIGSAIFFSSARLSRNGRLFIGSADKPGPLYAIDAENGEIIWKTNTDGPIVGTPLLSKKYAIKYY